MTMRRVRLDELSVTAKFHIARTARPKRPPRGAAASLASCSFSGLLPSNSDVRSSKWSKPQRVYSRLKQARHSILNHDAMQSVRYPKGLSALFLEAIAHAVKGFDHLEVLIGQLELLA